MCLGGYTEVLRAFYMSIVGTRQSSSQALQVMVLIALNYTGLEEGASQTSLKKSRRTRIR